MHTVLWQLCMWLARQGALVVLTKFALIPAGLEWVSPPVNPWDWRTANKCLCSLTPLVGASGLILGVGVGEKNGACEHPHGWRSPPTHPVVGEVPQHTQKSARTVLSPVASALCKLPRLHCLFTQAGTWLSLTLLDHPVLSQLTSKAPGSKLKGIWPLSVLKPNVMRISLPCVSSLV